MSDNKIAHQPEYDALNAFDAENGVEPCRTIAERIVEKYFEPKAVSLLVDDIAHALEDAHDIGVQRGQLIPRSS